MWFMLTVCFCMKQNGYTCKGKSSVRNVFGSFMNRGLFQKKLVCSGGIFLTKVDSISKWDRLKKLSRKQPGINLYRVI